MSNAGRVLNQLASLFMVLSTILVVIYVAVFLLDPFAPPTVAPVPPSATPSITPTPSNTRPPIWTSSFTPTASNTPGPTLTPSITNTPEPTRTPLPSRTQSPTPGSPVPTFSSFRFTKTNDDIEYRSDPYGAECGSWLGIAGQVIDVDGTPLPGITIVGWGGPIPEQNKRVFVSGSSNRINTIYNSPAAYEIFIGAPGEFDFIIQVFDNGQAVSDFIRLRTRLDCRVDLAIITIQRNH